MDCLTFRSYGRQAVSHCAPLRRGWRSGASPRRAAASGLQCRRHGCWRRPAALSPPASSAPSCEIGALKLGVAYLSLLLPANEAVPHNLKNSFSPLPFSLSALQPYHHERAEAGPAGRRSHSAVTCSCISRDSTPRHRPGRPCFTR
jgi:hypothetical protein